MTKFLKLSLFLILLSCAVSGCAALQPMIAMMKDPLTAKEHNNLGVAYEKEGKYDLALKEYKKAIDKDRKLIIPLVNTGNVYLKQGKYKEAQKYYLKALKKDQKNIEAANNLASVYIATKKDYGKGLKYLLNATGSSPDTPAYALDTLGVLYFRLGDQVRAKEIFAQACKKSADDKALFDEVNSHVKEMGGDCASLNESQKPSS